MIELQAKLEAAHKEIAEVCKKHGVQITAYHEGEQVCCEIYIAPVANGITFNAGTYNSIDKCFECDGIA